MPFLSLGTIAAILLANAPTSEPSPSVYALVVGSRNGGPGQNPLQYSGKDAERIAELLIELGRYPKTNIRVLQDPNREQLLSELRSVEAQLRKRQGQGERTSLLFYYSGHARASGLSLGSEDLSLNDLRNQLVSAPSDLTIAILDACQSGEFSHVKGAEAAPDFSINSVSQLNTRGLAVMASSTGSELSQESDRLAGSYFTHHLLMGLRGAADIDGDGRVTLTEAYRYAYARTLIETAATSVGSQHATLETSLQGKGEIPLTYPKEASASLSLAPELRGKILVSMGDSIIGELDKAEGSPVRLGLPPGHYSVIVRQSDSRYDCAIDLLERRETALALGTCAATSFSEGTRKGEEIVGSLQLQSKQAGWHFEAQVFAPLAIDSQRLVAFGGAAATYYFEKLYNDRAHALELLPFLQHPSSISVLPNLLWSSTDGVTPQFGGIVLAAIYPWQRTGFTAGLGGAINAASSLQLVLGIRHYLLPTLSFNAGYRGFRYQVGPGDTSVVGTLTTSRYDDASLGMTGLWAKERLLTDFSVTIGGVRQLSTGGSRGGTHFLVRSKAEYFINRRTSIGAEASLERNPSLSVDNEPRTGVTGTVAPSLSFYVSDAWRLTASCSLAYMWLGPEQGLLPIVANLGALWRF